MRKLISYFIVVILSVLTIQCSTLRTINFFPDSKDVELGRQFDEAIRKNPQQYPILNDRPDIKEYIEAIGKKILASPYIKYRNKFAYKFEVIHNDSVVNAFCTPGGYIYVYTGLMKFVDNEATLAGVIAHEIAHAECRHSTRQMSMQYGTSLLLSIALGENPSMTANTIAKILQTGALLKYSRSDEDEADAYSVKYLQSTEYYPGAIKFFFEKVAGTRKGAAWETLLSTHPHPQDRLNHIDKLLNEIGNPVPTEENVRTTAYQKFKQRLP
ncbi:MAG: M48 family metallopeptidase [Bacteroidetes bacterium]|nr:M48 family metallopeptidase [Bacteroidota bacterium]